MSSSKSDFIQYHRIVSQLANRGLSGLPSTDQQTKEPESGSSSLVDWLSPGQLGAALPAASLLVRPATDDACFELIQGFGQLAQAGRQLGQNKTLPTFLKNVGENESGHPLYLPLVVHLHLAAFAKLYEKMPMSLWSRCEDSLVEVMELVRPAEQYIGTSPATDAGSMAVMLWQALCLLEYAQLSLRDVDVELVDSMVHKLITTGGTGPLQPQTVAPEGDNAPAEAHNEAEGANVDWILDAPAGLHALANLAALRRNRRWADRVQEIARRHIERTGESDGQVGPTVLDGQPWGLFAYFWSRQTRGRAIAMIEQLEAQASLDCLSTLLLADAAHAFSLFE